MSAGDNGQFIVPPPGIAPGQAEAKPIEPEPLEAGDLITLPPGIVDSATYRMLQQRPASPDGREDNVPVFFPSAGIGLAPAVPALETAPQEVDDATRVSVRRRNPEGWRLTLPDGQQVLLEQTTLLGRDPANNADWPQALLLPIIDQGKTISKTHAALELTSSGQLLVHDLDSTNGVFVGHPGGAEALVEPGAPALVEHGAQLSFGEFPVSVERQS